MPLLFAVAVASAAFLQLQAGEPSDVSSSPSPALAAPGGPGTAASLRRQKAELEAELAVLGAEAIGGHGDEHAGAGAELGQVVEQVRSMLAVIDANIAQVAADAAQLTPGATQPSAGPTATVLAAASELSDKAPPSAEAPSPPQQQRVPRRTCGQLRSELARARAHLGWSGGGARPRAHSDVLAVAHEFLHGRTPPCGPPAGEAQRPATWHSALHHELAWRARQLGEFEAARVFAGHEQAWAGQGGRSPADNAVDLGATLYAHAIAQDARHGTAHVDAALRGKIAQAHGGADRGLRDTAGCRHYLAAAVGEAERAAPGSGPYAAYAYWMLGRRREAIAEQTAHVQRTVEELGAQSDPVDRGLQTGDAVLALQERFYDASQGLATMADNLADMHALYWVSGHMDVWCQPSPQSGTEIAAPGASPPPPQGHEGHEGREGTGAAVRGKARYWLRATCYWDAAKLRGRRHAQQGHYGDALAEYHASGRRMKAASERFQKVVFPQKFESLIAEYAQGRKYFALGKPSWWSEALAVKLYGHTALLNSSSPQINVPQHAAGIVTGAASATRSCQDAVGAPDGAPDVVPDAAHGSAAAEFRSLLTPPQLRDLHKLRAPPVSPRRGKSSWPGAMTYLSAGELTAMTVDEFQARFMLGNAPVMAEDPALAQWPAMRTWANLTALAARFGPSTTLTVAECPYSDEYSGMRTEALTVGEFVRTVMQQGQGQGQGQGEGKAPDPPDKRYIFADLDADLGLGLDGGRSVVDDIGPLPYFTPRADLHMVAPSKPLNGAPSFYLGEQKECECFSGGYFS